MCFSIFKISRKYGTDDCFVCRHKPCMFRKVNVVTGVVLFVGCSENEFPDIGGVLGSLVDLLDVMLSGLKVLVELLADKAAEFLVLGFR